ncbi:MAG: hypothetical protein JSU97_00645 [Dehalococcoidia bacterium]|nr:MAG: hypothetical protein JSU97_00645 [Dehalococcoidia bacterium]
MSSAPEASSPSGFSPAAWQTARVAGSTATAASSSRIPTPEASAIS